MVLEFTTTVSTFEYPLEFKYLSDSINTTQFPAPDLQFPANKRETLYTPFYYVSLQSSAADDSIKLIAGFICNVVT